MVYLTTFMKIPFLMHHDKNRFTYITRSFPFEK